MLEIARHFEQAALGFNAMVLIWPGLAAVLLGLFLWLGGIRFRKILLAVIGAAGGFACGYFVIGRTLVSAAVCGLIGTVLARVFAKAVIALLAAVLAACITFGFLARPYIEEVGDSLLTSSIAIQDNTGRSTMGQTVEKLWACGYDFDVTIRQVYCMMPLYQKAVIVAVAAVVMAGGFFLRRFVSALCCASLGTILVFGGMILLLLFKGAKPLTWITAGAPFYAAVFVAMTTFGTLEQLFICPLSAEKPVTNKKAGKNKNKQGDGEPKSNWRNK